MQKIHYQPLKITPPIVVIPGEKFIFSDAEKKNIQNLWEEAKAKEPLKYFDGNLFVVEKEEERTIFVKKIPYSIFFVLKQDDSLRKASFTILSVSGVIHFEDQYLIASRINVSSSFYEEFVPSGAVDADTQGAEKNLLEKEIQKEFIQETDLSLSSLSSCIPFLKVYDDQNFCLDICFLLTLKKLPSFPTIKSNEYTDYQWISKEKLKKRWEDPTIKVIPTSKMILENL